MEILLVDDNIDYLHLMKHALFQSGYTVYTAEDGIQACEVLTSQNIDLIISDIRMPRFDGVKLHAFARELERHAQTRFIFLSAFKDIHRDTLSLNAELDYFLDKTATPEEIIKLVDKLVFGKFAGLWN
jgi:DNA-binding response OmpR family regulator